MNDVERFSRAFNRAMEEALGEDAGRIEVEISSPGAERQLRVPEDFFRFPDLPVRVDYRRASDDKAQSGVYMFLGLQNNADEGDKVGDEGDISRWALANVRVNRANAPKGRVELNRKQRDIRITIPVADITAAHLFLDV